MRSFIGKKLLCLCVLVLSIHARATAAEVPSKSIFFEAAATNLNNSINTVPLDIIENDKSLSWEEAVKQQEKIESVLSESDLGRFKAIHSFIIKREKQLEWVNIVEKYTNRLIKLEILFLSFITYGVFYCYKNLQKSLPPFLKVLIAECHPVAKKWSKTYPQERRVQAALKYGRDWNLLMISSALTRDSLLVFLLGTGLKVLLKTTDKFFVPKKIDSLKAEYIEIAQKALNSAVIH